ncbi:MAG: response regulator [Deltaproteobacteria bacterium]|nr:response regulator [Deltaproteobacteria bacterium]MBF0523483.1 response regulator [Deltaproteobacteria bacterium]
MPKARIMIVEDEAITARELAHELQELGYEIVSIVVSGEKAVRLAEENHPDLILMDIKLVGSMDGIEAAQEIKNKSGVPVIFLTSWAEDEFLARAKVTEPFGYLLKPYNIRELRACIEMALYRAEMEAKVKKLSGLLPICASCKKIRDDQGYWQRIEKYIQEHSEALFTHGVCPDCVKKLYPEYYAEKDYQ